MLNNTKQNLTICLFDISDRQAELRFHDEVKRIYAVDHNKPPFGTGSLAKKPTGELTGGLLQGSP